MRKYLVVFVSIEMLYVQMGIDPSEGKQHIMRDNPIWQAFVREDLADLLKLTAGGISALEREILKERLASLSPFDSRLVLTCVNMFLGCRRP